MSLKQAHLMSAEEYVINELPISLMPFIENLTWNE